MLASEVGTIRLLNLFKKYKLRTSFFIPGHSIESFPAQVKMIVDHGHEIGAHGYLHENPIAMTPTQEEAVLVKSIELIGHYTGLQEQSETVVLTPGLSSPCTMECGEGLLTAFGLGFTPHI